MKVTTSSFNINRFSFAIPLMALASLGALAVCFINHDPSDSASAADSLAVNSTYGDYYLSLTAGSGINLDLETTATGGYTYATDDVTVATNAPGYDLYISSADSSNAGLKLNGTETTTNKIINASSATGGTTGTAMTLAANTYGYAVPSTLACNGDTCNSNFDSSYDHPSADSVWAGIPTSSSSDNSKIRSTTAATSDDGDNIDVHYGVYANNALVAGDYTGSVVYTAIANAPADMPATISPTSGTQGTTQTVTITSGPLVVNNADLSTGDVSITLGTTTCTVTSVDTTSGYLKTKCAVPSTLAAGTYTVNISVDKHNYTKSIDNGYVVQVRDLSTITYMQNATSTLCNNSASYATDNKQYTLKDKRDNNSYTIRKLADGHCWMTQNLRLGNTDNTTTLTSSDSDVSSNFTLPKSSTSGFNSYDASYVYIDTNANHGGYYSWYAATASTGTSSISSGDTTSSICPKGWKLPKGDTSNYSWYYLAQKYGYTTTDNANPFVTNFKSATSTSIGASYYYDGSLVASGAGYWWSRTANNTNKAYYLNVQGGYVHTRNSNNKYYGCSVRCVLSNV